MKNYLKIFAPLALAVLVGSLTFAFAQQTETQKEFKKAGNRGNRPMDGEFGRMPPPPPHGIHPRLLEQLNLTDEQKGKIREIQESSRTNGQTFFEKLRVIDEKIKDTTETANFDEAAARQLLRAKAEIQIELEFNRLKADSAVYNVLTPEQNAQLQTLKQQRPQFPPRGGFQPGMPEPPPPPQN